MWLTIASLFDSVSGWLEDLGDNFRAIPLFGDWVGDRFAWAAGGLRDVGGWFRTVDVFWSYLYYTWRTWAEGVLAQWQSFLSIAWPAWTTWAQDSLDQLYRQMWDLDARLHQVLSWDGISQLIERTWQLTARWTRLDVWVEGMVNWGNAMADAVTSALDPELVWLRVRSRLEGIIEDEAEWFQGLATRVLVRLW